MSGTQLDATTGNLPKVTRDDFPEVRDRIHDLVSQEIERLNAVAAEAERQAPLTYEGPRYAHVGADYRRVCQYGIDLFQVCPALNLPRYGFSMRGREHPHQVQVQVGRFRDRHISARTYKNLSKFLDAIRTLVAEAHVPDHVAMAQFVSDRVQDEKRARDHAHIKTRNALPEGLGAIDLMAELVGAAPEAASKAIKEAAPMFGVAYWDLQEKERALRERKAALEAFWSSVPVENRHVRMETPSGPQTEA